MASKDKVVISIESENNTKKGVQSAEKSFKGLSSTVTKLAAAGFGIVAIKSFGEAMLSANIEAQKLNASLVSVLGGEAAASRAFQNLSDFATRTPFQLNEVVNAFIKMKSLGLDASEEALVSFGNTASAMGRDLNQMIEAVADASTGEFERLKEFGIKAKSEGDKVSFTFQGVTTTVGKNAKEITEFLRTIGDEKFGDAMSEQMKTLGGAVSNAEDAWNKFLVAIGNSGVADAAGAALSVVTTALNQFSEAIDPTVQGRIAEINDELTLLFDQLEEANAFRTNERISGILQASIDEKVRELEVLRSEQVKDKELAKQEAKAIEVISPSGGKQTKEEAAREATDLKITDSLRQNILTREELEREASERSLAILQTDGDARLAFMQSIEAEKRLIQEEDVAAAKATSELKAKNEQQAADAGMQALSNLSSLMNSESKKAFEIGKLAAIASTTIDTFQSATAAFKALAGIPIVGPALGAVAAGAAIAAGLANVQSISSQQFQGGGGGQPSVPNINTGSIGPQAQTVAQPQATLEEVGGANIEVRTGSILGVWVEEELIPAVNEATRRGVTLIIA